MLALWLSRTGYTHKKAARQLGGISIRTFDDWFYGKRTPSQASWAHIKSIAEEPQ